MENQTPSTFQFSCRNFMTLNTPKRSYTKIIYLILFLQMKHISYAICPASVANSNTIVTESYNFPSVGLSITNSVASGAKSNSLYFLYYLHSPFITVVRKINQDGTQSWMTAVTFESISKSLVLDVKEQQVYFGSRTNPLNVIVLSASNGAIAQTMAYPTLDSISHDTKIHVFPDNSGYYITGIDNSNIANL